MAWKYSVKPEENKRTLDWRGKDKSKNVISDYSRPS